MLDMKEKFERIMKETGRIREDGRIEIVEIKYNPISDYATVVICGYRKRCRKAFHCWEIVINIATGLILWDHSTNYSL